MLSAATRYRRPALLPILPLLGTLLLAGCPSPTAQAPGPARPLVVTSLYPLTDWVRQIAGEAVEVYPLLPPGASPHTFEPTPRDAQRAARAALLVVIGLGLDDWARRLTSGQQTPTLVLGDLVETIPGSDGHEHEHPDHAHGPDPHVWLDPERAARMVERLTEALVELAPASRSEIEQRRIAYRAQLQELAERMPQACRPYAGRRVVTVHAGFQYFLLRCSLPPAEVVTLFPGQEPSARYLQELGRKARQERIKVIFAEPQLSPKAAEVLAREIGGQVLTLDYLGNPDDPTRDTYLKIMQFNLEQLLRGLRAD